jgi:hypothetical protein
MQTSHISNVPANMVDPLPSPLYIVLVLLAFVAGCVVLILAGVASDIA